MSRAACPAPGRSPPDIVIPAHPPMADRRGPLRRRGGRRRRRPRPVRGRRRARGDRGRLRAAAAGARHGGRAGRRLAQGARGGQQVLRVAVRQRRPRRGVHATRPIVIERTYRQQRLIPCAMEPRAVVVRPGSATSSRCGRPPRSRTSCGSDAACHRHPRAEAARDRPRRGRRLRLQAAGHRRRGPRRPDLPQARPAGQVDRVAQRGQHDRAPRPRPDAAHQDRRRQRRPDPRPGGRPARRHGRLPDAGHAGRAAARRVHVPRHLQDGRVLVPLHRRVHHQDADRRLPRRRPARGDVRDRADHGRAGRPSWAWTRWSCASGTGSSTRSSRTPRSAG